MSGTMPEKNLLRTREGCLEVHARYGSLSLRGAATLLGVDHSYIWQQFNRFGLGWDNFSGPGMKIGFLSCTHLGCSAQQLTHLRTAYDIFAQEGVQWVFHCGDVVAGTKVYKGQEYDLYKIGATAQKEYAAEVYPRREGITTFVIDGNHDFSFFQEAGASILKELAAMRPDMEYLGDFSADKTLAGIKVRIMHGMGANSTGFKLQKLVKQIPPHERPDIFAVGHWHKARIDPGVQGTLALEVGCFQGQTSLGKRMGVEGPDLGAYIVNCRPGRMAVEYIAFSEILIDDFGEAA